MELEQQSPLRFLRPYPEIEDVPSVVIVNTAGGVVGGDRVTWSVEAVDRAQLVVVAQAAEKVYGSSGTASTLDVNFESRGGAKLEVLPQGTIIYDAAHFQRTTKLVADAESVLLYGEILYFGRAAMGEELETVSIHDRTEIWLDGRRRLLDIFRLGEDIPSVRQTAAGLAGARAMGVAYLLHPDAASFLPELRDRLGRDDLSDCQIAAGCFEGGPLVIRWLARDAESLRLAFGTTWMHLRKNVLSRPERMPRIWSV